VTKKNAAAGESKPPASPDRPSRYLLVPRAWLGAFLILFLAPWLIVGFYVWRNGGETDGTAGEPTTAESRNDQPTPGFRKVGPWGQLEYVPIMISPPLEFIPDAREPFQENRAWFFKDVKPDDLSRFLQESGLPPDQVAGLMSTARLVPQIQGVSVIPPDNLVLGLSSSTRGLIYGRLAECELNGAQRNAFRFCGSFDQWFGTSRLPKETISLVEPLAYQDRDFTYFSDIDLISPRIGDDSLRRRLTKVLFRESTLLVYLRLPEGSDLDRIADYWGTGGRRLDIRPLLESLDPDKPIDISLLLPVFARRRVYTYRPVTLGDFAKSQQVNCFWVAMNFFNDPPDDRFINPNTVFETIKRDYYLVHDNLQLGDLVLFADDRDNFYHAAVYIADDIVFTKNGDSILSPFILVPLDRIEGYYSGVKRSRIYYYRLKRLS
jgi:hypothetical protein